MIAFRLMTGQYKCTCHPGRHDKRIDNQTRRQWGCEERSTAPVFSDPLTGSWTTSEWDLHRCPAEQVDESWAYAVSVWMAYGGQDDRGPLPVAGGWMDQTVWFADADTILRSERLRYLDIKRKQAEAGRDKPAKGRRR